LSRENNAFLLDDDGEAEVTDFVDDETSNDFLSTLSGDTTDSFFTRVSLGPVRDLLRTMALAALSRLKATLI
jgi:hypothetical protein